MRCRLPRVLSCRLEPAKQKLPPESMTSISGPREAAILARALIGDMARENFLAMFLSSKHCILAYDTFTYGAVDEVAVAPSGIVRGAVMANAVAVITAHNHPSGNLTPSSGDTEVYHQLKSTLACVGVKYLDDLIIGVDEFWTRSSDETATF